MRGLVPYAWRGLVARPARTVLTSCGIAIGTGVLVAALATSAGLDASIDREVTALAGRADVRVGSFTEAGLSAATLEAIDAVPGIAISAPAIERRTFLGSGPGQPPATEPVTVLGIDPAREPRVRDLDLVRGASLDDLDEPVALIPERLATTEGLDLGSELQVMGAGPPLHVRVVGILRGDGPLPGSAGRTVVLPLLTAARLAAEGNGAPALESIGGVSRVDVVLAAGATPEGVTSALSGALVTEPYVLSTPPEVAAALRASTADVRTTMGLLAAIALFAAAFVILNTLAMTVVERVRELGLLRAAGATRGQVTRVVLAQALLLGVLGSLLGLALGALLAAVVAAWLRATGSVPIDGPVVTPSVLVTGFGIGFAVTLAASLEPARRAAGISPVAALRSRSDPRTTARAHAGWLIGVMVVVAGLAVLLLPAVSGSTSGAPRAIAVYAILLGAVLLTPILLRPLGRLLGLPFSLPLRLEERLARAAIARDRARTTLTVGALVVGLAMVVALGSVSANARTAATAWLADVVPGDEILVAITPVPADTEDGYQLDVEAIEGVRMATPIASFGLAFAGTRLDAVAIDGADVAADGRLTFVEGDRDAALAALDAGGAVIMPRSQAERIGVRTGDPVAVATAEGLVELTVAGLVERSFPGRSGEAVLVGWRDAVERFGVQGADVIAVRYAAGSGDTGGSAARAAVAEHAGQLALSVEPISRIEGAVGDALDRVIGLLDLLALAAVLVAALGIVNTLSMDTWERIRELGMLRAAGMSRAQVWRSVLVEAGILGGIGGLVGAAAGVAVGVLLVATIAGGAPGGGIVVPWPAIALAVAFGVALAMLAAAQPARIAGRRSIVAAVRTE